MQAKYLEDNSDGASAANLSKEKERFLTDEDRERRLLTRDEDLGHRIRFLSEEVGFLIKRFSRTQSRRAIRLRKPQNYSVGCQTKHADPPIVESYHSGFSFGNEPTYYDDNSNKFAHSSLLSDLKRTNSEWKNSDEGVGLDDHDNIKLKVTRCLSDEFNSMEPSSFSKQKGVADYRFDRYFAKNAVKNDIINKSSDLSQILQVSKYPEVEKNKNDNKNELRLDSEIKFNNYEYYDDGDKSTAYASNLYPSASDLLQSNVDLLSPGLGTPDLRTEDIANDNLRSDMFSTLNETYEKNDIFTSQYQADSQEDSSASSEIEIKDETLMSSKQNESTFWTFLSRLVSQQKKESEGSGQNASFEEHNSTSTREWFGLGKGQNNNIEASSSWKGFGRQSLFSYFAPKRKPPTQNKDKYEKKVQKIGKIKSSRWNDSRLNNMSDEFVNALTSPKKPKKSKLNDKNSFGSMIFSSPSKIFSIKNVFEGVNSNKLDEVADDIVNMLSSPKKDKNATSSVKKRKRKADNEWDGYKRTKHDPNRKTTSEIFAMGQEEDDEDDGKLHEALEQWKEAAISAVEAIQDFNKLNGDNSSTLSPRMVIENILEKELMDVKDDECLVMID